MLSRPITRFSRLKSRLLEALNRGRKRRLRADQSQQRTAELLEDRCLLSVDPVMQITSSVGQLPGSFNPSTSDDGTLIVFESPANLTGENPEELATQVFLHDTTNGDLTQLTDIPPLVAGGGNAQISGDGSTIVFDASNDLLREPNSVFLYDVATQTTTQLTTGADSFSPSVSQDGSRVAFTSEADLTGQNSEGNRELFLYDRNAASFTQITDANTAWSRNPAISGDGARIVFRSGGDFASDNSDGNEEVFLYDTNTSTFTQVTDTAGGTQVALADADIDFDGSTIVFRSDRDIVGSNADENDEIFLYNVASGVTTQVTSTTGGQDRFTEPVISADGERIVFAFEHDLTGGNPDQNEEIFTFDISAGAFTQITDTVATGAFDLGNFAPDVSANGSRIVFASDTDPGGMNPDVNLELFLFDGSTGLSQLTATTFGGSYQPSVDSFGRLIAFQSNGDMTGDNSDGTSEIFTYDLGTNQLRQLTDTMETGDFSGGAKISGDASRIAFVSTANLTGENSDGNSEIFYLDVATGSTTQVTDTLGGGVSFALIDPVNVLFELGNQEPSISHDGSRIAFESDRDLTGGNADENPETFLFDVASGTFTQVTNTTGFDSFGPGLELSGDGNSIVIRSSGDFASNNSDGSDEIFVFDVTSSTFQQITNVTPSDGVFFDNPAISYDGSRTAFVANADLAGANADLGPEIFVYDSTTSSLSQITSGLMGEGSSYLQRLSFTDDGNHLSFVSSGDHTDDNSEGNAEVFLYDLASGQTKQISKTNPLMDWEAFSKQAPAISGNGERLVWQGTYVDPTGQNPDRNNEIYTVNLADPFVTATKTDELVSDVDDDGQADPGDVIEYTVQVDNTGGGDAQNVLFSDTLDPNTTLVPGSINVSPLAFDDSYGAIGNVRFEGFNLVGDGFSSITISDPASGLFANDMEFLGDTYSLTAFDSTGSAGGNLSVNSDGTFSYVPPTSPDGLTDTFTYTITDTAGLSDTGRVLFDLRDTALTLDGVPINISHVTDSGTGNGSFESPFGSLSAADSDASKSDRHVVYVYSGTTFTDQSYALAPNQRLLGEGDNNQHLVMTDQLGLITLPSGNGPGFSRPTVSANFGSAFLNSNTELSNFVFLTVGPVIDGVNGDVNANRLQMLNPQGSDGITVANSTGTFTFTDVAISTATIGILLAGDSDVIFGSDTVDPANGLFGPSSIDQITPLIVGFHTGSFTLSSGSSITSSGGEVSFIEADGIYSFDGDVTATDSSSGFTAGISIQDSDGAFTFSSLTVNDPTNAGLRISGGSSDVNIATGSSITTSRPTASAVRVENGHSGSLTFNPSSSISATDGDGLQFDDADGTYEFRGSVTLNGGDAGIDILGDSAGTFTFTDTDITYGGSDAGINITGHSSGNFTFDTNSSVIATNGTGLQFDDADGTYDFRGQVTLNGGDAGIDILGDSAGTFTFTDTDITDPSGPAFKIEDFGDGGVVDFGGNISSTNAGDLIEVNRAAAGSTINFNSTGGNSLSATDGGGISITGVDGQMTVTIPTTIDNGLSNPFLTGISIFDSEGTVSFTDTSVLNQTLTNAAVEVLGNPGTVEFTNLEITTDSPVDGAVGFQASSSNVVRVLGNSNNIDSNGAAAIELINVENVDLTFNDVTTRNTINEAGKQNGIAIIDVRGGSLDITGTTMFRNIENIGIFVDEAGGTFTFADLDIDGTGSDGISLGVAQPNPGTFNFNGGSVTNVGRHGARVNNTARVNLADTSIDGSFGNSAVRVDPGLGTVVVTSNNGVFRVPGGNADGVEILTSGTADVCLHSINSDSVGSGSGFGLDMTQSGSSVLGITQSSLTEFQNDNTGTGSLNTSGTITFDCSVPNGSPLLAAVDTVQHTTPVTSTPAVVHERAAAQTEATTTQPIVEPQTELPAEPAEQPGETNGSGFERSLQAIVEAAKQRWVATGLNESQIGALESIEFAVVNLPGWYLGSADGFTVQIDVDAGGYGWFIDATPLDDSEFTDGTATGMDLLTTVMHEMGHVLGLGDIYDSSASDDLMFGFLTPDERRTPRSGQAGGSAPGSIASTAFIGSPISIGTLPAGKTVTIVFDATVNDSLPDDVQHIANQGTVSADNFDDVLTDDPTTQTADDPTLTLIDFDEPALPSVSIANAAATTEGNDAVFTVMLSEASTRTVSITYSTRDGGLGGAVAPDDYVAVANGTLTFEPGTTSQTVRVQTVDDSEIEATEEFFIDILSTTNATIEDGRAVAMIRDNDDSRPAPGDCHFARPGDRVSMRDGTLFIVGTNGNDTIHTKEREDILVVTMNTTERTKWAREGVSRIVICGLRGRDLIDRDGRTTLPSLIDGGRGPDSLHPGNGPDEVLGGPGNDEIRGNRGQDTLKGGSGNDAIDGQQGHDIIYGGSGRDTLRGGTGSDTLLGSHGADRLFGEQGRDLLRGGNGNDQLDGGVHEDLLEGGAGEDGITGDTSADILISGTVNRSHAALRKILNEWTAQGRSYDTRIRNIRGDDPDENRANGNNFLNSTTVVDDGSRDRLAGNSSRDWFFASIDDLLRDRTPFEELDLL